MSKKTVKLKKKAEFHQPYNPEWEKLTIFQGWLSSVPESKYRAICKYCNKEFRAHRTDLRTHAQSRKHKKNADDHYFKEIQSESRPNIPTVDEQCEDQGELSADPAPAMPSPGKQDKSSLSQDGTYILPDSKESMSASDGDSQDNMDPADDVSYTSPSSPHRETKPSMQPKLLTESSSTNDVTVVIRPMFHEDHQNYIISTQVQDMVKGLPVDRLVIHLFAFRDNVWRKFGKGVTEKNGRCTKFIKLHPDEDRIVPGQYKLRYETKMHFTLNLDESIFPFIEVSFEVVDLSEQYEVNLLISPYGYMVFRKS